jgi:hypothetical protein
MKSTLRARNPREVLKESKKVGGAHVPIAKGHSIER